MSDHITFTKVSLPYGWLSNMSPHRVMYSGIMWRTAEHMFQALRFPHAAMIRAEIYNVISPMGAKFVAKKHVHEMLIVPRSAEDLDLMRTVLNLKYEQHEEIRRQLALTNDAELIEDVSKRPSESGLFWGVADPKTSQRRGQNWLGRLWMEIRDRRHPWI